MRLIILFFSLLMTSFGLAQNEDLQESKKVQEKLNQFYLDEETTVLTAEDFENFEGLDFFPLSEKYVVEAKFIRTPEEKPFEMPTTTERTPEYVKYAELHFVLEGDSLQLNVYQETSFKEDPELKDYLFIPFTDPTNGEETYGGGRYLDMKIPITKQVILDFNKAYNPYCAYNPKYSCPIPPIENDLPIAIKAGVKNFIPK